MFKADNLISTQLTNLLLIFIRVYVADVSATTTIAFLEYGITILIRLKCTAELNSVNVI